MRTIEDIKADIELVKQDIKECKERGDNTWAAQMVLKEFMRELRQKERDSQMGVRTVTNLAVTNLERRALLGDRQAQEECTRKGIVLPCPFCGGEAELIEKDGFFTVVCKDGYCISSDIWPEYRKAMVALADWNTRQGPLIGRCVECKYRSKDDPTVCSHPVTGLFDVLTPDDFCSYFSPKDGEENAKI